MQAGQNPADPLTQLNGPAGHGLLAGFNPFAGTGVNTNDPNMVSITPRGGHHGTTLIEYLDPRITRFASVLPADVLYHVEPAGS